MLVSFVVRFSHSRKLVIVTLMKWIVKVLFQIKYPLYFCKIVKRSSEGERDYLDNWVDIS